MIRICSGTPESGVFGSFSQIRRGICLTTNSPASHYGIPALRIETDEGPDLGPSEFLRNGKLAAAVVAAWATKKCRKPEELEAARRFLRQWPDGPQVEVNP